MPRKSKDAGKQPQPAQEKKPPAGRAHSPKPSLPQTSPASATTKGAAAQGADAFIAECIAAHNLYRARHGAQAITHDPALTQSALKWAQQVASTGNFAHSTGRKNVGENIAMKWTSDGAIMSGLPSLLNLNV